MIDTKARPGAWVRDVYRSQLGKKALMAVSGIMLFGYVLAHMLGNLKIYLGPAEINKYAEALRTLLEPIAPRGVVLWILRTALIAAFVIHIVVAAQLTAQNRRARPERYENPSDYLAATYASRTMRWTGVIVALFVLFHLMNLTWGNAHPDYIRGDVYHNVVTTFRVWPISAVYIVANLALGLHLYHGLYSLFQSLGLNNPRFNGARTAFARTFAIVVTLGNLSFPIAVLSGALK